MNKTIRKRIVCLLLMLSMICIQMEATPTPAANSYVTALSSLVQSYTLSSESGTFKLTESSRFYYVSEKAPTGSLKTTIETCASEFAQKNKPSASRLSIVYGASEDAKKGDILIHKDTGSTMKTQEYRLVVSDRIDLYAKTNDGIFYGLRTILKYMLCSGSSAMRKCTIKDYPDVSSRTLHLDCARKYFSPDWIKKLIRQMSWMGYNALEVHFSEDQGLRLESKKFPWLAGSQNGSSYLTQDEMASICREAKKYHIEIVPSFDSPGHMDYIVKTYKNYVASHPNFSFTYDGKTYNKNSSGFSNISNYLKYNGYTSAYNYRGIDLANKTARAFASALIDEYADFFAKQGCTKFNIGGDELLGWATVTLGGKTFNNATKWNALQHWEQYARNTLGIPNGSATDTFICWLNSTAERLAKKGYTCRVWNDEIYRNSNQHVALNKDIRIVYWSNDYAPISTFTNKGYRLYNVNSNWTYYVVRYDSSGRDLMNTTYKYVNGRSIYNSWDPKSFANPGYSKKTVSSSNYSGAYFAIWCDYANYKSAATIWNEILPRMWANSTKMWNRQIGTTSSGNGIALTYDNFVSMTNRISK